MLTAASLGASKRAASCCLTRCTCNVSSRRGFLATDSCESSVPDLLTCVGISNGALLSMLGQVAVSPFKYASKSRRSGRCTTGIFSAYTRTKSNVITNEHTRSGSRNEEILKYFSRESYRNEEKQ